MEILGDLTNLCISTLSLWKKIQLSLDEMAQFISFQALVEEEEYTSGGEEEYNSEDDNSSIDNSFESENKPTTYHKFDNVTRNEESALEDTFSDCDLQQKNLEVSNYCQDSDDNDDLGEIHDFKDSDKKLNYLMKILHIPNCLNSENSLFYSFCYAIRYSKIEKIDQHSNKDLQKRYWWRIISSIKRK